MSSSNAQYQQMPEAFGHTVQVGDGGLDLTLQTILETVSENVEAVADFAETLRGENLAETAFNIWHYLKENTRYVRDRAGVEEIRTPQRLLSDKKGDCDDYSIFAASILKALGYEPFFYVVAFHEKEEFGHIYAGVKNIVIDGVMNEFNKHPDFITKQMTVQLNGKRKTKHMKVVKLNGIDTDFDLLNGFDDDFDNFEELEGLGEISLNQKINTYYETFRKNGDKLNLKQQADYTKVRLLKMLEGHPYRDFFLSILPAVSGLDEQWNIYLYDESLREPVEQAFDEYIQLHKSGALHGVSSGLGSLDGRLRDRFKRWGKKIKGAVNRVKKSVKRGWNNVKKAGKKAWTGVKKVSKKVWNFTKKVSFAPIRGAFLLLLKVNFLHWGERFYIGYLSTADAKKNGLNLKSHAKVVQFVRKFERYWKAAGGDVASVRKTAKSGRPARKAKERYGLQGVPLGAAENLAGLGEPTTAAAAGTASGILAFLAGLWKSVKSFFKNIKLKDVAKGAGKVITSVMNKKAEAANDNPNITTSYTGGQMITADGSPVNVQYPPVNSSAGNKGKSIVPILIVGGIAAGLLLKGN